jgi:protein-disulfide isomerase
MKQLQTDMIDPNIDTIIEIDKKEGTAMGVTGTPTLFVNNKIIDPLNLDVMIAQIETGLK